VSAPTILVVDDEKNILTSLKTALSLEGFGVSIAGSGEIALEKVELEPVDLVLLDVMMPGMDGMATLKRLREGWPALPVVMMSGHGTIGTALEAIRNGAVDFVEKPLSTERLILTMRNVLQLHRLERENVELRTVSGVGEEIIGGSAALAGVLRAIAMTAPTSSRVLVLGENGTGKELVARAIHAGSPRSSKPFVKVNCAAIPAELLESELFGHVRGAFTGAIAARKGQFELADGGTIFLDEIGDMKLDMQSKLLRVLQEGEFEPVGSERTIRVDVRVLSATNRDLEKMIREDQFRQDLYYRLAVIPIRVPPLRERIDDIPALVEHFARAICAANNRPTMQFSGEAVQRLRTYPWPGNIRELKNIVERLIILSRSERIEAEAVTAVLPAGAVVSAGVALSGKPLKDLAADFEKAAIEAAIERAGGNMSSAARDLGLERSHLYKKIRAYGIAVR
jgi:DNA-binding NtrC family response regulator